MSRDTWDVIVIGAGPAGAMAALGCARGGASVLLLDKQRFPRDKTCGCCLNAAAIAQLDATGLGSLPVSSGGQRVDSLRVACGRGRASIPLPPGYSLSRAALDAGLVSAAVDAGAVFRDGQVARVGAVEGQGRNVVCGEERLAGRCVVLAGGLGVRGEDGDESQETIRRSDPRIGLSAIVEDDGAEYGPGVIHMACGRGGYVGLVRLEDGRLNVAAAMDPRLVRRCGGASGAAEQVLRSCGMTPPVLATSAWRGTPLLTRRRRCVAGERLLVVGDAAGYVEPFTGEGIAWALAGGRAVAELAVGRWEVGIAREWERRAAALRRRQWVCRAVAGALRHPWLVEATLAVCDAAPAVAGPVVAWINRPIPIGGEAGGAVA